MARVVRSVISSERRPRCDTASAQQRNKAGARGLADGSRPALALAAGLGTEDDGPANEAACRRFMLRALLLATIG